jgi:hypothetical protein
MRPAKDRAKECCLWKVPVIFREFFFFVPATRAEARWRRAGHGTFMPAKVKYEELAKGGVKMCGTMRQRVG